MGLQAAVIDDFYEGANASAGACVRSRRGANLQRIAGCVPACECAGIESGGAGTPLSMTAGTNCNSVSQWPPAVCSTDVAKKQLLRRQSMPSPIEPRA